MPKLDKMVLLPIPDTATRKAALRSGQVDWIEAPSPDAVPSLQKAGLKIVSNAYPHNWTWHLSIENGGLAGVRSRQLSAKSARTARTLSFSGALTGRRDNCPGS